MPPRKSHKKSKAGCQRCKIRKIKVWTCDEVHPSCQNCLKHGVPCDFEELGSSASSLPSLNRKMIDTSGSTSGSTVSNTPNALIYKTPDRIPGANTGHTTSRSLELKLMHHFTTSTSLTFSNVPEQMVAWQCYVPAIAYDADYLMDAILAVSALHLRSLHPNDQSLVRASHSYMASALAQYTILLIGGLSKSNAEALFATSSLIAFQASASRRFEVDNGDGPEAYTLPLAWFHSFQGVKTVVMASWQWLRSSDRIFPIINSQSPLSLDLDLDRKSFFAPLLGGLDEQLDGEDESSKAETRRAYEHAMAFLNWAHHKPERARILGFAAIVSRRFVELLEQQDPRTLVLVACFFAMTRVVDDVWWLQGIAKREVMGIYSLLPQDWWGKLEWPMRIVEHDGPMDDDTWGTSWYAPGTSSPEEPANVNVHAHIDMLAQIMNDSVPPLPPD